MGISDWSAILLFFTGLIGFVYRMLIVPIVGHLERLETQLKDLTNELKALRESEHSIEVRVAENTKDIISAHEKIGELREKVRRHNYQP